METNYASFKRRLSATLADSFVLMLINFLFGFALSFLVPDLNNLKDILVTLVIGVITYLILTTVYYLVCWLKFDGATIGKKLAGIKIIKTNGSSLTLGTSILRIIGYWISLAIFGLGYLWVLWDKNKQGWHDKMAKTYVVNTGAKPKKALLWIFAIGFIILSSIGSFRNSNSNTDVTFINEDGSSIEDNSNINEPIQGSSSEEGEEKAEETLNDKVIALKILEQEGKLGSWEYFGYSFEFYEKAKLNIDIENDYELSGCVFTETEFFKYQKEEEGVVCLYEVTSIPAVVPLEAGKYVFVAQARDNNVSYKVSLNATK